MPADGSFDADGRLWPGLYDLVDNADPVSLRQQVLPDPCPYKVYFGHLSQDAYGQYDSAKRQTALSNLVAAIVDSMGGQLAGIAFYPSRQGISGRQGAALLYPVRAVESELYMDGLKWGLHPQLLFGLSSDGTVRVVSAQEAEPVWHDQAQGVQRPGRLLAVTTLEALKFRVLLTANAMYLPHPQETVLKIRGLPHQLFRKGAVGLLLQAAGYHAPECVCRVEYTMPAVLPGGQVTPWLEDPGTLCAVVAPPPHDMLLRRLPRSLLLPGQPGKVCVSVQPSKVRVVAAGPGDRASRPGIRDTQLQHHGRGPRQPVQQAAWRLEDTPRVAAGSDAAADAVCVVQNM